MPSETCTILVADDDEFVRDDLADLLQDDRYRLSFAETAKAVKQTVKTQRPDLVLLDIKFPDCDDLSVLEYIRKESPGTEVIIISSQTGDLRRVVEAIKLGAFDYVPKPIVFEELRNRVDKAMEARRLRRSQAHLLQELERRDGLDQLVGSSNAMKQIRMTIKKLANLPGCVLIKGESGTGKELVARALHFKSVRRGSPFKVVNCASIPEHLVESLLFGHAKGAFTGAVNARRGIFDSAEDGTIFLDEIGDMPLPQQASLLRVLEYRRFTPVGSAVEAECRARFVFATNRDLREVVRKGEFREDLFYRINVATVSMTPLRSRPEDIGELVEVFCRRLASEMGRPEMVMDPDVLDRMLQYDWPGNVRELKNVLEAALMLIDPAQKHIALGDLPAELLVLPNKNGEFEPFASQGSDEQTKIVEALRQSNGNQTLAAKILGCHRNTLRAKIRQLGIVNLT